MKKTRVSSAGALVGSGGVRGETSRELYECSISQLLSKLRAVIDEKNIEVDQHIRRMKTLTSKESDIVSAISWRMGV